MAALLHNGLAHGWTTDEFPAPEGANEPAHAGDGVPSAPALSHASPAAIPAAETPPSLPSLPVADTILDGLRSAPDRAPPSDVQHGNPADAPIGPNVDSAAASARSFIASAVSNDPFVLPALPGPTSSPDEVPVVIASTAAAHQDALVSFPPGFFLHDDPIVDFAGLDWHGGAGTSAIAQAAYASGPWADPSFLGTDWSPAHGDFGDSDAFWSNWAADPGSWFDWDAALHHNSADWFVL